MTYTEYKEKLDRLATSDAPIEVKQQAIENLRMKYERRNNDVILETINESKAEGIDYD